MDTQNNLQRFIDAQNREYDTALSEIRNGRKQSHWMWYIFPQIQGLGHTETSMFYAIKDIKESQEFLAHPTLGARLIRISEELLTLESSDAHQIFGRPDDLKLKSSMTLFSSVNGADPVFNLVLEKFFNGSRDHLTLKIIETGQKPGAHQNL